MIASNRVVLYFFWLFSSREVILSHFQGHVDSSENLMEVIYQLTLTNHLKTLFLSVHCVLGSLIRALAGLTCALFSVASLTGLVAGCLWIEVAAVIGPYIPHHLASSLDPVTGCVHRVFKSRKRE